MKFFFIWRTCRPESMKASSPSTYPNKDIASTQNPCLAFCSQADNSEKPSGPWLLLLFMTGVCGLKETLTQGDIAECFHFLWYYSYLVKSFILTHFSIYSLIWHRFTLFELLSACRIFTLFWADILISISCHTLGKIIKHFSFSI